MQLSQKNIEEKKEKNTRSDYKEKPQNLPVKKQKQKELPKKRMMQKK